MTKTIDLGSGRSFPRRHVPNQMLAEFDAATAALSAAQASIKSLGQLVALQAPSTFSGTVSCTAPGQSLMTYDLGEVGGCLLANEKDVATFTKLGFTAVPSVQPTSGLRPGLVFFDVPANGYFRFDGSTWEPISLT